MQFILIVLLTVFSWLIYDSADLGVYSFYTYLIYLIFDIVTNKKISLLLFWNFSFFFIIISESLLTNIYVENYLIAYKYLLTANALINIGYLSKRTFKIKRKLKQLSLSNLNHKKIRFCFLILLSLFFFSKIERSLHVFAVGRNVAYNDGYEGMMFSELINSIGLILPSILTYY